MKTLTQILTDVRCDLKDAGTLWTTAELTRCVEKAVGDYSRFQPKENVHEFTIDYTVSEEAATSPAAADPDSIVDGADIAATVSGGIVTITTQTLDTPRPVILTVTDADASITVLTVIVKGTDADGIAMEESFQLPEGLVQTGKKYFKTVFEVEAESIDGNGAGDTLDLGYATHEGVWVELAYKPIKPDSDVVTSSPAGTSYTRNTDYEMDYANGRIRVKASGSMAAASDYLVSYTKSRIDIDLGSLPGYLCVNNVMNNSTAVPQETMSYELWGKILTIKGNGVNSQEDLSAGDNITVKYYAMHSVPKTWAGGSYPAHIENTIILATEANALFMMATKYEHQAVTDIAYVDTALDKVITELASADTQLTAAAAVWADEVKHILTDEGLPNMEDFIEAGDAYVNALGNTADPAENNRKYAETAYLMARAWEQKRTDILTAAARYLDKSSVWIGEGQARMASVAQYLELATRFQEEGNERRSEAWLVWTSPNQLFVNTSTSSVRQPKY